MEQQPNITDSGNKGELIEEVYTEKSELERSINDQVTDMKVNREYKVMEIIIHQLKNKVLIKGGYY